MQAKVATTDFCLNGAKEILLELSLQSTEKARSQKKTNQVSKLSSLLDDTLSEVKLHLKQPNK